MIEVFVEQVSERLIYTLDFIFKERDISYKITNDLILFSKSTNIKLNYSSINIDKICSIKPSNLLYQEQLEDNEVSLSFFNNNECLSINGIADPLASIFYVLSRYEEYTNIKEDIHGRFLASYSIQKENDWLDKAICDRWSETVLEHLKCFYNVDINYNIGSVNILPTFDIDNTYAFLWKKGIRKYLSILRDRLKLDSERLSERKLVLSGDKKDPYDTFDYINSLSDRGFKVNIFWLLGGYAKYDKNISSSDTRHRDLIKKMSIKNIIGIHPSYKSNSFKNKITQERERLSTILNRGIYRSRQHFLKFNTPITYSLLNSLGFKHEFSMGYPDEVGFRCGTARPHFWFDLNKNQVTNLMIHPFSYMDGTLNEYMNLSIEESKKCISQLFNEVKRYGGDFVFIWHNETIGDYGKWAGWKNVLEYTLNLS
ncbi:polysaccharide deacetylase family protein [Crocinitomicaceae bacterium]|nr:polysaccharide deacetylase family protein [Crocinitomicaceae bacterium]